MPSSIDDLLIEKGFITEEEYEKRVKEKVKGQIGKNVKKL